MIRRPRITPRQWLILLHDFLATAAAFIITLEIRFDDTQMAVRAGWIPGLLLGFTIFCFSSAKYKKDFTIRLICRKIFNHII